MLSAQRSALNVNYSPEICPGSFKGTDHDGWFNGRNAGGSSVRKGGGGYKAIVDASSATQCTFIGKFPAIFPGDLIFANMAQYRL